MSKVEKMSLIDILSEIEPMIYRYNVDYIFEDSEKLLEFLEKYKDVIENGVLIVPGLLEYETYINKEKLVLVLMFNYKENIIKLERRLEELIQGRTNFTEEQRMVAVMKLQKEIEMQKQIFNKLVEVSRGIRSFLINYYYIESEERYRIVLLGRKDIIDEKIPQTTKSFKKFDKVDSNFKKKSPDKNLGLEFALQSLLLTDLSEIFTRRELGAAIRTMILDNNVLKRGEKTHNELEQLKRLPNRDEYEDIAKNINFVEILSDVKETLREYAEHMDIDKLLLISAFRFFDALENNCINPKMQSNIEEILQQILSNISDKKLQIDCELEMKDNGIFVLKRVTYSVADLEKTLSRFNGGSYISLREVEEYRKKVNEEQVTLLKIPAGYADILFSIDELKELALLSEDNLIYVAGKLNWKNETILTAIINIGTCSSKTILILLESEKISLKEVVELYEENIISLDTIIQIKGIIDLSEGVDLEKINEYYTELQENSEDEELVNRYNKYVELYKMVYIEDKSNEEKEKKASSIVEMLIENFEGKEYNKAIKEYYKRGLITLNSIVEWSNENLVVELYNEGIILLQELEDLTSEGKVSKKYIIEIYEHTIWDANLKQEQRVSMLIKGWISIETIEQLFRKNLIDKEDLRILVDANIISEESRTKIIESLSREEAEANSSICLVIDESLKKIKGNERCEQSTNYNYRSSGSKDKIIISPNAREEFFELLGAKKVRTTKIDEDNPFYNYQFYVIPGKDGKIHLNSPVIAERYYEDKETERIFATDNATYFFQYGDLMVLSNYAKKDEVVGKKENVVFRSNHTIANEKRKGNWASSVIGNIVRTLLSSDLKEYNSENQKLIILAKIRELYTSEQIMEMLSLEEEIDSGKHLYEVIKEKAAPNFDDNDDGTR